MRGTCGARSDAVSNALDLEARLPHLRQRSTGMLTLSECAAGTDCARLDSGLWTVVAWTGASVLALPFPLSPLLLVELRMWLVLSWILFASKKDGTELLEGSRLLGPLSRVRDGPAEGARVTKASIVQVYCQIFMPLFSVVLAYN
jgi:hypothetical protein